MVRRWAALAVAVCAASDAPSRRLQQEPSDAAMRLIVLSGARTGSSLLIETLRRHADILMHGEIFHENDLRKSEKDGFDGGLKVGDDVFNKRHATPRVLLDFVASHSLGRKVVGFKLFSEHLEWQKLPAFFDWASHVVVLQRTHMLAQYVSICVAQRNNDWVQHDERRRRMEPVALDVGNFESWRHREVAFADEAARAADRLGEKAPRVLKINYEENLCMPAHRVEILDKLAGFLDLAAFEDVVHSKGLPVKQHDHTLLESFVTNWDDLPPVLAGYEFANYLEPYEVDGLHIPDTHSSREFDKIEPRAPAQGMRGNRWAVVVGPLDADGNVDASPDARLVLLIDGFLHQLIAASKDLNPGFIFRKAAA
ncbi:phytanoyl-CoA dioxygenase [Aureococcus anophagefferens]|nr:phytanoyl-CoA dioxygenase [Aureococcus anophagefferens]